MDVPYNSDRDDDREERGQAIIVVFVVNVPKFLNSKFRPGADCKEVRAGQRDDQ